MRLLRPLSGSPPAPTRLVGRYTHLRMPEDRDWRPWADLRAVSREFLIPWEPTWPPDALTRESFRRRLRRYGIDWREDGGYSFFIFRQDDNAFIGGVTLGNVRRGVAQSGTLGYWIGQPYARRGYMTDALRAVVAFSFEALELHRLEAACLPTNTASRRVLCKIGFKEEGYARKYLRINGEWSDHLLFALIGSDTGYPTAAETVYE
jgi:[ribosomal protein S5]-alanine N-acetyltransferase